MNSPESMQRLEELFHDALGLDPSKRADFIARLRTSDPELGAGVESLLAAHDSSTGFIDSPAYEAMSSMIADEGAALAVGQIVGHYKIISPLGKGGMGEVYLASDTKLDRKVALKLLPVEFTNHKDRLRRFILEAKAASSLNHPNIITIHEISEFEGAQFIATEFINGQTLKDRLLVDRMKLPEILDVAIQVAEALQAAHEARIVHRDMKPENIMVRPDGYVKVLDFGLAKLAEEHQATLANSEVATIINETKPGTVLGTVNYMSPEQARAQMLDHRTDIFSLGVVMYEMEAGRRPFSAATNVDTLVSILEKEPAPLDEYAPEVPQEFERIVTKSLRKDRAHRYQSMTDLLIDLKNLREELLFAQKLRSRPLRSTVDNTNVTTSLSPAAKTDQDAVVRSTTSAPGSSRKITIALIIIVALGGLSYAGIKLWTRPNSGSMNPTPVTQRTLSYWITVQKYRNERPYEAPFRLRDDINFEKDYRIRLTLTNSGAGHLYLLNEGPSTNAQTPTFNVIFPSTLMNQGSALVAENQQIQIPQESWLKFDAQQGTEKIWVVWTEKEVAELEAVKGFANPRDQGVINSPGLRTAVNEFLKAHTSVNTIKRNEDTKETVVQTTGETMVHVIKLEHH